jgi:LAO/AO transport system kinase
LATINAHTQISKRPLRSVEAYVEGIISGDRQLLSEAITLVESKQNTKREHGLAVLSNLKIDQANTLRIGITGTPGVGKSTFIEVFGKFLINKSHKIAVLAIDPSSAVTQGSILGDKTRMELLSNDPNVYIRPTSTSNILGGTAANTREAISLCEAAGFTTTIIETVGVGQSETEVNQLVDINILLLQPGAGDEIQGIKRGIVEQADIIIVHKSDGLQLELANRTRQQYQQSIQLFHHELADYKPPVIQCSSIEMTGQNSILSAIDIYVARSKKVGFFDQNRIAQETYYIQKMADFIAIDLLHNTTTYQSIIKANLQGDQLYARLSSLKSALNHLLHKI